MLKAGEARGRLPEALGDIARLVESQRAARRKVLIALLYPSIVIVLALGLAVFLVLVVTPRLLEMYDELEQELPRVTTSLMTTADVLRDWAVWVLVGIACLSVVPFVLRRSILWRVCCDWVKLRLPLVGGLNRKSVSARFARAYSSLMSGGVDVGRAVKLAGGAMGNQIAEQVVVNAAKAVESGEQLSRALGNCALLDPLLLSAIQSGEKTGKGDELLAEVADGLDAEAAHALTVLMVCLPVVALFLVAGLVVWLVLAIAIPWFQLPALISI